MRCTSNFLKAVTTVLMFTFSVGVFGSDQCSQIFKKPFEVQVAEPDSTMTSEVYHVWDTNGWDTNGWFYFKVKLDNRRVSIKANLADHTQRVRSSIRGSEAFAEMIEHFGKDNVDVVQGRWFQSSWSNYRQFMDSLESGMSMREAAFSTWTGRQAKKHGYTYVDVDFDFAKTGGFNLGTTVYPQKIVEYVRADFYKIEPRKILKIRPTKLSMPPPMEN